MKIFLFVHEIFFLSQTNSMKTSTKILIVITILLFVPNIFLTKYLLQAIVPTGSGFELNFTPLAWVALVFQILFNIFFAILFFRFLKTQRLSNVIFFSLIPLTLVYGIFMVYIVDIKNQTGLMAESVKATLNITAQENSYNNLLWAGLATLVYLIAVFVIVLFACRPLSKVEAYAQKLGDGRTKNDTIKVGGGKQFKEIENSLNKINFNYKEKMGNVKKIDLAMQKNVQKQLFKLLGADGMKQLEQGKKVQKSATILFCDLKSSVDISKSLTLEENFNYVNSYMKIVSPLVKRYEGIVDKYLGDGILAVFAKSQNAIECAHSILSEIGLKNKSQKNLPDIEAKIAIFSDDVVFGVVGEGDRKTPTITSDVVSISTKIEEINSYIGTKILISQRTLNELPQGFDFTYRYTGSLTLEDGKEIGLFESLDCYGSTMKNKLKKYKNKFESAVRAYTEKDYKNAKTLFAEILKVLPDDKPSFVYFNKASEKIEK